jgi:ABC-type glycerol-3-phosphate transport system substrate-binding protein
MLFDRKIAGRRPGRRWALAPLALVALVVGGSPSLAAAQQATPASSAPMAKSITLWTADGSPQYTWVEQTMPEFTQQTGIQVNFQKFPEQGIIDKYTVAQTAHSTDYDIFEAPEPLTAQFQAVGALAPLNGYFNDQTATPASFELTDIPHNATAECTLKDQQYCLPVFGTVPMLWYNKQFFADAGIANPPQTWADVVNDAQMLNTDQHAGICMRGSESAPAAFPAQMMMLYYLPYSAQNQGIFIDPNWNPLLSTQQAHSFAEDYSKLMHQYAPQGVGAFTFTDCQQALAEGSVAMWYDDSAISARLYNPDLYPLAAQLAPNLGFDELPCPPSNPDACMLSAPWGVFINANVPQDHQNAAYELMKWITSKDMQLREVSTTNDPSFATRLSVLDTLNSGSVPNQVPKDLLTALAYGYAHISPNALPVTPAFNQMQQPLGVALSNIITGQGEPAAEMDNANSQIADILKQAGLLTS